MKELHRYEILDTPAEKEFDDITKLAAEICGTPVALISLIDADRQWFKSKRGLAAEETPRDLAFCAHALEQRDILEVPDASRDERFSGNIFVTGEPNIRFYAGAPLVTPAGFNLGTLCVIDQVPRHLSAAQRSSLAALGRVVVTQLELRRAHRREQQLNQRLDQLIAERTGQLRDSNERFRLLVEGVRDYAIIMLDPDGRVVSWNAGAQRFKGYTAEEIQGSHFSVFYPADEAAAGKPQEHLRHATEHGRFEQEGWRRRKSGEPFWASVVISPLYDASGKLRGFSKVTRDITERRRAAVALAESEERFRQLAENSSEGFWFVALNPRRLLYINSAIEAILGLPAERLYETPTLWRSVIHPEDIARVVDDFDAFCAGRIFRFDQEFRVVRPDRTVRWIRDSATAVRDATGNVIRVGGIMRDITDSKHAEAHRLRTQRVESIGTLAGGIAHDLNNALAPILMGVELLRLQHPANPEIINTIEASTKHSAGMVRQLLTFAKGVEGERVLIQTRHLLREMQGLIENTFPKNIRLEVDLAARLGTVTGDPTQLHQVFLNLCVNARDAMPQGGVLTITAENCRVDRIELSLFPEARPGDFVLCQVKDTGTGIPPEILDRIYEPFFTTKGPDRGTGLGLSTALGIVKSHGGFIRIDSRPGAGSVFAVYLPAAKGEVASATPSSRASFHGNGEKILVVDDSPAVREVARSVLTSLNFRVITAANGADALLLLGEHRSDLRVVISDIHMPQMEGLRFIHLLRQMLPAVEVIVCSGRLEEREAGELLSCGITRHLDKPFTQEKLLEQIQGALNGEKSGSR